MRGMRLILTEPKRREPWISDDRAEEVADTCVLFVTVAVAA